MDRTNSISSAFINDFFNLIVEIFFSCRCHLIVVAVTKMKTGFCYICYCIEKQRLVRPIYNSRQSFWIQHNYFNPNSLLRVEVYPFWFDPALPHGNEDMLISPNYFEVLGNKSHEWVYSILWYLSEPTVLNIFGHQIGWKYVPEGTKCRSVGVLRVQRKNVLLLRTCEEKSRLRFSDESQTQLDLPLTSVIDPDISLCHPEEYVLLLIGLGRPYAGD